MNFMKMIKQMGWLLVALSGASAFAATERLQVGEQWAVCVYCGASDRTAAKYTEAAWEMGEAIARQRWTLVWGGSKTGLMGAVARGAKESGGRVVGVLPEFIRQWEVAYEEADELMTVTTMHERKMLLQARSDAFVILPGGLGTLDELGDTLRAEGAEPVEEADRGGESGRVLRRATGVFGANGGGEVQSRGGARAFDRGARRGGGGGGVAAAAAGGWADGAMTDGGRKTTKAKRKKLPKRRSSGFRVGQANRTGEGVRSTVVFNAAPGS